MRISSKINFWLIVLAAFLAIAILSFDLHVPLGVAGGVPYIAVVLVALWLPGTRYLMAFAILCIGFTILGFFYSPPGGEIWKVLANRFLAIAAISVTTILSLQRKRSETALQNAYSNLENIIEFLPDATFVIDREQKVVAWNRAIEKMTGVNKQDIISRGNYAYAEALFGKQEPILIDQVGNSERNREESTNLAKRSDMTLFEESTMTLPGNKGEVFLWSKASPLHDQDGHFIGAIESIRDITKRKAVEEELLEANRELNAFAYTVSHDLRTPLTPIIGYSDLLLTDYADDLGENGKVMLKEINQQAYRMLDLMDDLLLLARTGHVDRPAEPVDANVVALDVIHSMKSLLDSNRVTVQIQTLPKLCVPKTLLFQVFDNLIGNAARYAGREGNLIEVDGSCDGTRVRFSIRDHGPGITAEESSQVFNLFYRGSEGKRVKGTGLGLATVLKIAQLYEGHAWVEETPGGGCTFWVEMEG
jgi:PAS domain S-box-containing protein